jgi:hypothetical protein
MEDRLMGDRLTGDRLMGDRLIKIVVGALRYANAPYAVLVSSPHPLAPSP